MRLVHHPVSVVCRAMGVIPTAFSASQAFQKSAQVLGNSLMPAFWKYSLL